MPSTTDYYELLHIQPDAPEALIKASYRTLMQKLRMHPDLGGDATLASELNVAYETLSNPGKRAEYDLARASSAEQATQTEATQTAQSRTNAPPSSDQTNPQEPRVMWQGQTDRSAIECLFCAHPHSYGSAPPPDRVCDVCGCPLLSAGNRNLVEGERRALERLQLERVIKIRTSHTAVAQTTETKDLSLTGMKFQTNLNLVVDQLVQINSQFCLALARVAHITSADQIHTIRHPTEIGVEFLTLCFPTPSGSLISTKA